MKLDTIELFLFTFKEYKRFYEPLTNSTLTDEYDERQYTGINVKLMILRKYASTKENIYVSSVIKNAIEKYPNKKVELQEIDKEYSKIEKEQLEFILPDGTKLNLYETIEDVMYGIYLHADEERIIRLKNTDENLRFVCVREYVEKLEKILYKLYDCLESCYIPDEKTKEKERASTIYLGDTKKNSQQIKKSPYWSNLYGYDVDDDELKKRVEAYGSDELEIQLVCGIFLKELKKEPISISVLDNLILPSTKKGWGDYSEVSSFYKSIKNPGISTMIRYNKERTKAYVRIFPRVESNFTIETPHILNDLCEICLVKKNKKIGWKIYSFSGNLNSNI